MEGSKGGHATSGERTTSEGHATSGYYRDEFGQIARFYDFGIRTLFKWIGGEAAFRHGIIEAAELSEGHRVLDVSCGTGTLADMMAGRVGPGGRVMGIDLSEEMLKVARRKATSDNLDFIRANAEDLPFEDDSLDRATISLAVHEMNREGRLNVLSEMHRVLAPGGLAAVADMRPPDTWFARLGMRMVGLVETETLTDMWQSGLFKEMGSAGFTDRRRRIAARGFFEIVVGRK